MLYGGKVHSFFPYMGPRGCIGIIENQVEATGIIGVI